MHSELARCDIAGLTSLLHVHYGLLICTYTTEVNNSEQSSRLDQPNNPDRSRRSNNIGTTRKVARLRFEDRCNVEVNKEMAKA